ncbi:MAG: hypothetical protein H6560_01140 [Lewinellaceae bacterium]|nr:hypothetical protein [Lewinellaceae bacterium]
MGGCSGQGGPDVTQAEESAVEETTDEIAQQIIDAAIEKHGGSKYRDCRVQFNFRDKFYLAIREGSKFQYERIFTDSSGAEIRDVLTSEGFFREIEGQRVQLSEKDSSAYANSVNSVIYFALLPYFLNDPAVIKKYAGEVTIKGKPYQKVRVTFRREGGGKDFEDEYMYWIHRDEHTMDYLAYNFHVNGGGARFREAYAFRTSNGIRFANYHNYKPKADNRNVAEFDSLFENDGLEKVSDIELDHVRVVLDYW